MNTSTNQTSLTRPHARPRSRKAAPTTGRGWWRGLLLATVVLLAASCTEEEPGIVTTLKDTYQVRLMVNPQQAATRAPGNDENALRQLRVYVFNAQGNRVGYYENMNLTATGAYYVPFRLQEGGERRHPREGGCRGEKMRSSGKERVEPAGERGIEKR